jgi:hypothetical protein
MSTAIATTTMPNRIAAGVTAAYLRDLTRRPAPRPSDSRGTPIHRRRVAAAERDRERHPRHRRRSGLARPIGAPIVGSACAPTSETARRTRPSTS